MELNSEIQTFGTTFSDIFREKSMVPLKLKETLLSLLLLNVKDMEIYPKYQFLIRRNISKTYLKIFNTFLV